jgi:glycosyltransferase involved in cell wall biosynthesis
VINQTFHDWELILTDDGSTDNSLQIARSFNDPRIRIIHDHVNRGISFRLNQIISESKGKFIARMDADDIAFPERLEEQLILLENDQELDLIDSEVIIINEKNEITGSRSMETDFNDLRKVFDSAQFIHPTVMFRKSFIGKFCYDGEFDGAEDRDLWIRSHEFVKAGKINHPLLFYRESGRLNIKSYLFRCAHLVKLIKKHKGKIDTSLYRKLLMRMWVRKITAIVAHVLKVDALFIKRRNRLLPDNGKKFFTEKLAEAIKNG